MADWPLHITLADVFAIDRVDTDIDRKLAELVIDLPSFSVAAEKEATLGTADAVLLHKTPRILELHDRIINLLTANWAIFNTPEFIREDFMPHCTIQKTERLYIGDELHIEAIVLVDMFPAGDWQQRKVLQSFKLQKD